MIFNKEEKGIQFYSKDTFDSPATKRFFDVGRNTLK